MSKKGAVMEAQTRKLSRKCEEGSAKLTSAELREAE